MKQKLEQHRFKFFYTTAGPKGSVVVEAVSEEQAWLLFSDLDLDYTTEVDSVLMIEEDSRQLNLFDSVGS